MTCWSVMTPEIGAKISTMEFMLVGIVAEQPQMFGRGFHRYLGLVFGVLRDLQIVQWRWRRAHRDPWRAPIGRGPEPRPRPPFGKSE